MARERRRIASPRERRRRRFLVRLAAFIPSREGRVLSNARLTNDALCRTMRYDETKKTSELRRAGKRSMFLRSIAERKLTRLAYLSLSLFPSHLLLPCRSRQMIRRTPTVAITDSYRATCIDGLISARVGWARYRDAQRLHYTNTGRDGSRSQAVTMARERRRAAPR